MSGLKCLDFRGSAVQLFDLAIFFCCAYTHTLGNAVTFIKCLEQVLIDAECSMF